MSNLIICSMKKFLIIVTSLLLLVSCTNRNSNKTHELKKVTILLDWSVGSEHTFLYVGKKMGFFKEQGISLEIIQGTGSVESANMVDAKSANFALCSGETALQAKSAETPRNIQVISVYFPNTPTVIFSLKEKNITKPDDLYGKNVGIMEGSSAYKNYVFFCDKYNIDRHRIKEITTTGDIKEVIAQNSKLDAMVHFGYQHPLRLRLEKYEVNEIKLSDYEIQVFGLSLIAHSDLIETNPALVREVVQSIQKSIKYTIANPNKALNIFLDENPQSDRDYAKLKLDWVNEFILSGISDNKIIGYQTEIGWKKTYEYLKSIGGIKREINLNGFFTNDFLGNSDEYKIQ